MLNSYFCLLWLAFWPGSHCQQKVGDDVLSSTQALGVGPLGSEVRSQHFLLGSEYLDGCESAVGSQNFLAIKTLSMKMLRLHNAYL